MKKKRLVVLLLSFLLPCGLLLMLLAVYGIMPFGNKTLLVGDGLYQYYPFAVLFRRVIRSGGSLFYTWRIGFGSGLLPQIAYYCSNLYDLAACLLPESAVASFLTVSVCTRAGTAALFFALFLMTVQRKPLLSQAVFAWMYALSGWFTANCFQLIWLDCFAMMPLVMTGLVRLVRNRDHRLYTLALFACLICNYYFSFCICCMAGLFWIGMLIVQKVSRGELIRAAVRFFGCSLLAGGLAAVLLIPAAAALRSTTAAGMTFQDWDTVYEPVTLLLAQLSPFGRLRIKVHPVNFTAGILPLLCCFGFLTERRITLRERLYAFGMLLFLLLSLWWAPLNFAWHGFHEARFTVDRFAFLVPAVLCYMGARFCAVQEFAGSRIRGLLRACGMLLTAVLPFACAALCAQTQIPVLGIVFLAGYGCVLFLYALLPKRREICLVLTGIFAAAEVALNVNFAVQRVHEKVPDLHPAEVNTALDAVRADAAAEGGENLDRIGFRTEPSDYFNKTLLFDVPYNSAAFSSMNTSSLLAFNQKCGMIASPIGADFCWQTLSPFASQLLGISYVICERQPFSCEPLQALPPDAIQAYRTTAVRTAGFCIPVLEAYSYNPEDDPFSVQNAMFAEMTGLDTPFCEPVMPQPEDSRDLTVTQTGTDSFAYQPADNGMNAEDTHPFLRLSFVLPEDGFYYVWYEPKGSEWEGYEVLNGNQQVTGGAYMDPMQLYYSPTSVLGAQQRGNRLQFRFYPKRGASGEIRVHFVRINTDVCAEGLSVLTAHPLCGQTISDTEISGTVTAEQDSMLYLSVPYDKGWKAFVDGREAEAEPLYGAMTGIRLTAGRHEIRMRYRPPGLTAGCLVSAGSLLIFLALTVTGRKRKQTIHTAKEQTEE